MTVSNTLVDKSTFRKGRNRRPMVGRHVGEYRLFPLTSGKRPLSTNASGEIKRPKESSIVCNWEGWQVERVQHRKDYRIKPKYDISWNCFVSIPDPFARKIFRPLDGSRKDRIVKSREITNVQTVDSETEEVVEGTGDDFQQALCQFFHSFFFYLFLLLLRKLLKILTVWWQDPLICFFSFREQESSVESGRHQVGFVFFPNKLFEYLVGIQIVSWHKQSRKLTWQRWLHTGQWWSRSALLLITKEMEC